MFFSNLRRLWLSLRRDPTSGKDLKRFRPIARSALAWLIANELLVILQAYPYKWLVDLVQEHHDVHHLPLDRAGLILAGVAVIYIVSGIVEVRMDILRNSAAWLFWVILDDFGNRKQLSLGADWHVSNSSAKKESVLSKNLKKVDVTIDNLIFDIVPLTLRVVFIAAGSFIIGWQMGVLAVVTVGVYFLLMRYSEKLIAPMRKVFRAFTKRIERSDAELSSTAMSIKEQGVVHRMISKHRALLMEHWSTERKRHAKFRWIIWRQDQWILLSRLGFFALAIAMAWWGGLTAGTVTLAIAWMARIYENIWRYGQFQYVLNEGAEATEELVGLFETKPSIEPPTDPRWPAPVEGRVELKDVTFYYPGTREPALQDVSLTIEPGMTVALVGPSGGGKSTLAKLVQRLYDPKSGAILVDGVNLRDVDDGEYRRRLLGSVPQEPGLFDRTVAENIAIATPEATREEIERAARMASAHEFIVKLPQGYDTPIGERGIAVSGGQRARIAIARALIRDPSILVMDEPTSALDAESQLMVTRTLERLTTARRSTILIIAHRFSTIAMADMVVVMKDGRVDEIGTHAQLRSRNGLYARLHTLESQGLLT